MTKKVGLDDWFVAHPNTDLFSLETITLDDPYFDEANRWLAERKEKKRFEEILRNQTHPEPTTPPSPSSYQIIEPPPTLWREPYKSYAALLSQTSAAAKTLQLAYLTAALTQIIGNRAYIRYGKPTGLNEFFFVLGPSGYALKASPSYWMGKLIKELAPDVKILNEVRSAEYINKELAKEDAAHRLLCIDETRSLLSAATSTGTRNLGPSLIRLFDLPEVFTTGSLNAPEAQRPYVSMITATAIEAIEKYIDETTLTSGFINRCLVITTGSQDLLDWPDDPPQDAWNALVQDIRERLAWIKSPLVELKRHPQAISYWNERMHAWKAQVAKLPYTNALLISRTHLHAIKLAAINALLNGRLLITTEDLQWGWDYATYCQQNTLAIFSNWATTDVARMEISLRTLLKDAPRPKRDCQRSIPSRQGSQIFNIVVKNLKESGELKEFTKKTDAGQTQIWLGLTPE